jgi:CRP/FNR family cyclic AMP-dependent transcriptional regulator
MFLMDLPIAFPVLASQSTLPLSERNPAALLFEYMEQRFSKNFQKITAKRNSFLCCQGTRLSSLFLVQEGEILLTRVSLDGRDTLLSVLGPGEFFGESALLGGWEVTFSAMATKRSVVTLLPERKFRLLLEDPRVCRYLLETVARRCDDARTQMEVIGCTNVRDKVRSGLLWLSGRIGEETDNGIRLDLNQTRLARMVGCARETLSREVSRLKRMYTVDVRYSDGRKSIYIVDPKSLSQPV